MRGQLRPRWRCGQTRRAEDDSERGAECTTPQRCVIAGRENAGSLCNHNKKSPERCREHPSAARRPPHPTYVRGMLDP